MSDYMNDGYELGWDAEIENEGSDFVIAEAGEYGFTITSFERGRFDGSSKMPPCNVAKLSVKLDMPNGENCVVKDKLFLHSKSEWRLCQFFTSIGQRRHGEKVAMNWNAVNGARGRCRVAKRSFKGNDGTDKWTNDIERYLDPAGDGSRTTPSSDLPFRTDNYPQQTSGGYQQPSYQQVQPQNPPYQQPSAPAGGGYTPGKF